MNNPKISVIVPIYKVEKYLVQCLDSIINQTLKDIEIILVDEGDMDTCRIIIDRYEQADSRVKTIHEKNGSYGLSCNKGFDIATGEYISIIESDDFLEPTMFEEMYNYAKKLDADVVKTPYYEYWDKTKNSNEKIQACFWQDWVNEVPENTLFSIKDHPIFMGIHPSIWSCIYKKAYFDKYNVRFLEDKEPYVDRYFKVLALLNTDKIAWLNKPFYKYRLSNIDASASNFNLSVMIKRWNEFHKLIEKKFPDLWNTLAPYCIAEEWINTLYRLFHENEFVIDSDFELLINNWSKYTEQNVKDSPLLNKKNKTQIIKIKNNPKRLKKYIQNSNSNIVNISGMNIFTVKFTEKKRWYVLMFGILPLLKIKQRNKYFYKVYLFSFIPVIKMRVI